MPRNNKLNRHDRGVENDDADQTEEQRRQAIRDDARRFILEGAAAGVDPWQLLDELATFYDGDIIDLLP